MDPLYFFAHHALQRPFLDDDGFFEQLIGDKARHKAWLDGAAERTAGLSGLTADHAKALCSFSTIYQGDILGLPALIVELPRPPRATHCYFVAVFRGSDGAMQYYTLERSITEGEPMLCRWKNGTHSLLRVGPAPELSAFGDAIEKAEQVRTGHRAPQQVSPLH